MPWAFFLCPSISISPFSVQNNSRFERIALRNDRKREAHKEVLLCIPSSIPTPSSPLLFLSPLLPLPAQASPASRTSYDQTDTSVCLHILNLQPCKWGINQKCMFCSIKTDSICNTEGQREGKSKRKRQTEHKCKPGKEKGGKKTARKQARCWERESEEEWERGCLVCSTVNGFWETAHRCSWPPIGRTSFSVKTPPPAFCSTTITNGDGEKRTEREEEGGSQRENEWGRERTDQASVASDCLSMQSQHARLFTRPNAVIRFKSEAFSFLPPLSRWIHFAKVWWDVASLNAQILTWELLFQNCYNFKEKIPSCKPVVFSSS